jgi:hypothetical protein
VVRVGGSEVYTIIDCSPSGSCRSWRSHFNKYSTRFGTARKYARGIVRMVSPRSPKIGDTALVKVVQLLFDESWSRLRTILEAAD